MGFFEKLFSSGTKTSTKLDISARFRLEKQAVSGTMSTFRAANEIGTNKVFGIKFLDDEKTAHFRNRFKGLKKPTEGEIALKLNHPRIVKTYEHGTTTTGEEYVLMEFVKGPGLDYLLRKREHKIFKGHRLDLIRQMAEAINAVHLAGFIHRDICPRNFIVSDDLKHLKLIDFGLTVPNEGPYLQPGNRTGTPQYMAPEIVRRRSTDQRVDIFSFGVSVYRFLTFEHPWGTTDKTGKTALTHDTAEVTNILQHRPKLNKDLAQAVHRCLKAKPDDRPKNLKKFLSMIRNVEKEE